METTKNSNQQDSGSVTSVRRLFAFLFISLFSIVGATLMVLLLVRENTKKNIDWINSVYAVPESAVNPEPHEFQGYIVFIFFLCLFSFLLAVVYHQYGKQISTMVLLCADVALLIIWTVLFFLSVTTFGYENGFFLFFLQAYCQSPQPIIIFFAIIVAVIAFAYVRDKSAIRALRPLSKKIPLRVINIVVIVALSSLQYTTNLRPEYISGHFQVIFDPIYAIFSGGTLGAGSRSIYGSYSYFFYYVQMLLFGKITYQGTIMILTLLCMLCNILLYLALCRLLENHLLSMLAIYSIIYFCQMQPLLFHIDPYYAYFPIRLFIPVVVFFFVVYHHRATKQRKLYFEIALFVLTGCGWLWNIEMGGVALLVFIAYMIFSYMEEGGILSNYFWLRTLRLLGMVLLSVLLWFVAYQLFSYIRACQFIPLSQIFWAVSLFSSVGYNMLPLPEWHPYLLVLLIYAIAVSVSVQKLRLTVTTFSEDNESNRSDMSLLFISGVLGFGAFTYFLGRSHASTFAHCIWPSFIVLSLALKMLWGYLSSPSFLLRGKERNVGQVISKITSGILALLVFALLAAPSIALLFVDSAYGWNEYKIVRAEPDLLPDEDAFELVRQNQSPQMAVIDGNAAYYLSLLGKKNEYTGPCMLDFFFQQDYIDLHAFVETFEGRLFVKEGLIESMRYLLDEYYIPVANCGTLYCYDRI